MSYASGFDALASPVRRQILEHLAAQPLSVRELAESFPISRPAISQHLKALKDSGLVQSEARGTRRLYRVNLDEVARMRAYLDRFWAVNLAAFKREAERKDS